MACISCKSENVEYDSFEPEGMFYPVRCNDCDAKFWEDKNGKQGVQV